ncbi:MAG: Hsp20/alpha crystallin family protein [Acidobacteria bacterium]|nr:Hsp20/alpha crystallin family protein [Acidobacteriota bacterium]MCI0624516.1 Hsp20/alpha crystallin family protein [Acidobacteriota bacterium]MCI0720918.1 Hsp20/alpha crystallin family protein [Acidobacteriota bacterium]
MLALARRNPINDVFAEFDNLFRRSWVWPAPQENLTFAPEVESYTKDDHLVYRFAIPGVDAKDVHISTANNRLTVKVERKAPSNVKEGDWHFQSFSYGKFEQTVLLPRGTDPDAISATFKNGVLEVTAPLPKATLPKKIEVKELAEVAG